MKRLWFLAAFAAACGSIPVQAQTDAYGLLLGRLQRSGELAAVSDEDAGDRALSYNWVELGQLGGGPYAQLTFIGRGERDAFEPTQIRICEARKEEYGFKRDGPDYVTFKDGEGKRCFYANLGGGLERVKIDLPRTEIRRRKLVPTDAEGLKSARRVYEEARAQLGAADQSSLLAAINENDLDEGRSRMVRGVPQPDGRFKNYFYSIAPVDREDPVLKFQLEIQIGTQAGTSGLEDERWTYVSDLDGRPVSLEHFVGARYAREGAPETDDRRRFAVLLSGIVQRVRRDVMDEMLSSGR